VLAYNDEVAVVDGEGRLVVLAKNDAGGAKK
jgi:hypothetical protein